MPTQTQNLSREMTLYPMRCVGYLIGVYLTGTAHPAGINCQLATDNCQLSSFFYNSRESSTNRPFFVQTNPISKTPKISPTSFFTKGYDNHTPSGTGKTNPNEPKQSQSDPHFSPASGPQSQNKPKQTQSNPICSEPAEPVRRGRIVANSRTNAGPAARRIRCLLLCRQNARTIYRYGKRPEHRKGCQAAP
jgi:hypothetical protein